jgi:cleavage stimulation factor subunit 3
MSSNPSTAHASDDSTSSKSKVRVLDESELRAWARVERHVWDSGAWKLLVDNCVRDIANRNAVDAPATAPPLSPSADAAAAPLPYALERFVARFPTAALVWARAVDAQLAVPHRSELDAARALAWAERGVARCGGAGGAPVALWLALLRAARAVHSVESAAGREAVQTAFERAVASCGGDLGALAVWRDYLEFVRVASDAAALEEGRRITALRSIYQRALDKPLLELEQLWRQYDAFEQKISKVLAKGLLQEHSSRYMVARNCARQLAVQSAGIDPDALAVPPAGRSGDAALAAAWQRLIAFERTNPAHLDDGGCAARVARAYEQALLVMRHYPHVWYSYYALRAAASDGAGARAILTRAVGVLPHSPLLAFALSEAQELAGEVDAALRTLDHLLEKAPTAIAWARAIQVTARARSRDEARRLFLRARKTPHLPWQPYVVAAHLELDDRDLKVARNIFEFGLREHAGEPRFVEHYVDLLLAAGRPQDARALLERVLATTADDVALPMWNLLVRVERAHSDAAAERAVENRRAECYAELEPLALRSAMARFSLLDLQACSPSEMAAAAVAHEIVAPSDVLSSLRARPRTTSAGAEPLSSAAAAARAAELEAARKAAEALPRPDLDNMTPFLPLEDPDAAGGAGTALGVLRPSLRGVLERLPSARAYDGPVIDAEIVVRMLLAIKIPPHVRLDALDVFMPAAARDAAPSGVKRKTPSGGTEEPVNTSAASSTDIFRARRADKVRRGV